MILHARRRSSSKGFCLRVVFCRRAVVVLLLPMRVVKEAESIFVGENLSLFLWDKKNWTEIFWTLKKEERKRLL